MLTTEEKAAIDQKVCDAFASVANGVNGYGGAADRDALNARSAAAARLVYDLTRPLGLERQRMADAPPWKAPAGIPLNAFARRMRDGLLGEGLPGYVAPGSSKVRKVTGRKRAAAACCPHCGGALAA